jgi:class 3 adenylate cyclase/DNA-binding transcriptional MerR regulator
MKNQQQNKVLTSKEILSKTGISRATLNNYIKMGILPKPVVQKGLSGLGKTKLIGHFPVEVLERIEQVRQLKSAGNNMKQIAAIFAAQPLYSTEPFDTDNKTMSLFQEPGLQNAETPSQPSIAKSDSRRIADPELHLSISDINVPAYLVNYNFEIEWINQEAELHFFNKKIRSIVDIESRNIFKLFFSWEFHAKFSNWQAILKAHMTAVKSKINKQSIDQLYKGISESEASLLHETFDTAFALPDRAIQSQTVDFITSSTHSRSYRIHSIYFREGVLFIHIPAETTADALMGMLSNRGKIINDLLKQRMPSLVSLCVLVADLQDSVKISAELPPEEYFQLINEMWQKVTPVFEKYHGLFGKHAGDGILYYFLKKPGADYIMEAINCSIDLREKMKELSSEWRIKKNWSNELLLNCGLNEGQEFFGTIHAASHIEFTALGDSINIAGRLSDYARNGSIWTTKNVINKLSVTDRSIVNFGINRRQGDRHIFSRNSFARVVDLLEPAASRSDRFMDVATLPVTEITGIMKQISI